MLHYLVLRQVGTGTADLEVRGVVSGKEGEGERAIREAMTDEEGEYLAIPFDPETIVRRVASREMALAEPQ